MEKIIVANFIFKQISLSKNDHCDYLVNEDYIQKHIPVFIMLTQTNIICGLLKYFSRMRKYNSCNYSMLNYLLEELPRKRWHNSIATSPVYNLGEYLRRFRASYRILCYFLECLLCAIKHFTGN